VLVELRRIVAGSRVDQVQRGAAVAAVGGERARVRAAGGTDLHDGARLDGVEHGSNHGVPEAVHRAERRASRYTIKG
jgi:hypothetical protein